MYSFDMYCINECEDKVMRLIKRYIGKPLKIETFDLKVQYRFRKNIGMAANKYPSRPEIR
tara:strand:- start:280 stop:459 length:180 start_codon:yes stop_codon:yes gene_type:complete